MGVRAGDVFSFRYSEAESKRRFEPYHCFDGQLVAVERHGGIVLLDSYWLYRFQDKGSEPRAFTVDGAQSVGELTFKCNLNDVEFVSGEYSTVYFDDADVFDLSYQHRCHPCFAVRKGAVRSQSKMAAVIADRIKEEQSKVASANWAIERLTAEAEKVARGELENVSI